MVAFFSPCCVAMLPAYIAFALGKSHADAGGEEPRVSRGRREAGAVLVWGGLLVAALGLGRLALEALAVFQLPAGGTSPEDRNLSVLLSAAGILAVLAGLWSTADARRFAEGLLFGGLATLGFLVVFVAIGFPIAYAGSAIKGGLGWVAVAVGLGLVGLGVWTLAGRRLPIRIPTFDPTRSGRLGFLLYGVAYGLASLSCTFPIFLVVVSLSFSVGGPAGVAAFAAYALGKGSLMTLVTVLATASPSAVEGRLKKILPRFDRVMATVTILAGAFIVYYFGVVYARL